jgi:hypothetical protein
MRAPYRALQPRPELTPVSERTELGPHRSSHGRWGMTGTVAAALGLLVSVDLHQNGLLVHDTPFGLDRLHYDLPYDEIDALYFDFDTFLEKPHVSIRSFEGHRVDLTNDLSDYDTILAALARNVTAPLAIEAKAAFARGERLCFGPLVLELDGLSCSGKTICWSDLGRVVVEQQELVIHRKEPLGRLCWVSIRELPHPSVLLAVLRERTEVISENAQL